jgi:class 3 adenylate cyclase/Tfp pilus assembly protein PilF
MMHDALSWGMRTYDEISAEIGTAIDLSDSSALFSLADEMSGVGTDQAITTAIRTRARAYRLIGAYPEALEQFHRVIALYECAGDLVGMASANIGVGIVYYLLGQYADALVHYNRALELNKQLGNLVGEAATLGNIGSLYQTLGSYPEALECAHKALAIHDALNDRSGQAIDTSNIGILYSAIGSHKEALEYYNRSLTLHEELAERDGVAKVTHNIGIVYADTGEYAKAIAHFQQALTINREMNYPAGIAHVTGNYVDVLMQSGDFDAAARLHDEHSKMLLTVPSVKTGHFINQAQIFEHHNDLQGASDSLHEALRIAGDAGIRSKAADIHKRLRDLALKRSDLASYVEHNNEYTRITEEINGKDTAARLATQEAEKKMAKERSEHEKHLAVLHSTLPKHIADRVSRGEQVTDHYDNAAVLFLDVVGFTTHSSALGASAVVDLLQNIFTAFDVICAEHDVTKIKTIGDSYMAVAFPRSSPSARNDTSFHRSSSKDPVIPSETRNEVRAANAAFSMMATSFAWPSGDPVQFRIGLHCGPVVAGVLGTERMQYDVWGDTVNVASRMESTGEPGRIHVSEAFATFLGLRPRNDSSPLDSNNDGAVIPNEVRNEEHGTWHLAPRGEIEIKGKGTMTTYWLS